MGVIKELISRAAADIVEDVAINAVVGTAEVVTKGVQKGKEIADGVSTGVGKFVDATLGDKDTRHYRREQKYLSKSPDSTYLIIQKTNFKKDLFSIYNPDESIKYYVQGKLSSKNIRLSLLDSDKKPIANVSKTMLSLRMPVFHESKPADYVLEIEGEQVATLKTKLSAKMENYEIEPYGWTVKGNILKWDFTVNDGEEEIVHISKRKGYDAPTYIIDFPHEKYELIGLLIVLTLICREN